MSQLSKYSKMQTKPNLGKDNQPVLGTAHCHWSKAAQAVLAKRYSLTETIEICFPGDGSTSLFSEKLLLSDTNKFK